MPKCWVRLTLSFVVEPICLDNLLLNLRGHREHQLQHLAHVVAGTFSSLLHPGSIFWYWEGLDHLTQYHWKGNGLGFSSCYVLQYRKTSLSAYYMRTGSKKVHSSTSRITAEYTMTAINQTQSDNAVRRARNVHVFQCNLTSGLLNSEGGLLCWSWGHVWREETTRNQLFTTTKQRRHNK